MANIVHCKYGGSKTVKHWPYSLAAKALAMANVAQWIKQCWPKKTALKLQFINGQHTALAPRTVPVKMINIVYWL